MALTPYCFQPAAVETPAAPASPAKPAKPAAKPAAKK